MNNYEGVEFKVYINNGVVIKESKNKHFTTDIKDIAAWSQELSKEFEEIEEHYVIGDKLVTREIKGYKPELKEYRNKWREKLNPILKKLNELGFNLSDISHNNVIIENNKMKLIDLGKLRRIK